MSEPIIMPDGSLSVQHNIPQLPISIRTDRLSQYTDSQFCHHWNDDFEFIRVLEGKMYFEIDDEKILLEQNHFLIICPKHAHRLLAVDECDCKFLCVLASPKLFTASFSVKQELIENLMQQMSVSHYHLTPEDSGCMELVLLCDRAEFLHENTSSGYQLEIVGILHMLMARLYALTLRSGNSPEVRFSQDQLTIKNMISYIHKHYGDKITLSDISAAGGVCRSKCCSIFKKYESQSPIEYLNNYRLSCSRDYLMDRSYTVAEVASMCGFTHQSYFTKMFTEHFGYTPREFRSKNS